MASDIERQPNTHTHVSTTSTPDSGKQKQRDWRKINRRRKPHTITLTDDEWEEMKDAAERHGIDVSKMLSLLWAKRGRRFFK